MFVIADYVAVRQLRVSWVRAELRLRCFSTDTMHRAETRGGHSASPPPPAFSWPRYNFQKHFIVVCWSDNCFVSVPSPTPGEILDPTPMRGRILKVCSYVCRMLLNRGVFCPYRYYIGFFMFYQKEVRVVYAVVLRIYLFTSGIV